MKTMMFAKIPGWAIDAAAMDRYTIAAAFELAGLTNKWVRLSADTQRQVFGRVLFGKRMMRVTNEGIRSYVTVCFGTDFDCQILQWSDVERLIIENSTRSCRVSKGGDA